MPTTTYVFRATGHQRVAEAYQSIAKAAGRADNAVNRSAAAAERAEDRRERAAEKSQQAAARASQRRRAMEDRELDATARRYEKELREYERMERKKRAVAERESMARARLRDKGLRQMGGGVAGIAGAAGGVARMGAMAAFGGGLMLAQAGARDQMALQGMASRLAINSKLAGGTGNSGDIRRNLRAAAVAVPGVRSQDLAKAALEYQGRTGEVMNQKQLETIGTIGMSTGSDLGDLGSVSGALRNHMGITSPEDLQKALGMLGEQGARGEFELKDMAGLYNRIGAAAGGVQLPKGLDTVQQLGGMMQMIRQNTGSPEQAVTGVEAFFRQFVANSKKLEGKYKVDVFEDEGKTKLRDPMSIMKDFLASSGGSTVALKEIFGEEGKRGAMGFAKPFLEAMSGTEGTEEEKVAAGLKALDEALAKASTTTLNYADHQQLAAEAGATTASKLTASWESFMQRAEPAFVKMLDAAGKFAEGVGKLLEQFFPDQAGTVDKAQSAKQKAEEASGNLAQVMLDPKSTPEQIANAEKAFAVADAESKVANLQAFVPAGVAHKRMTEDEAARKIAEAGGGGFLQEMLANDAVNLAKGGGRDFMQVDAFGKPKLGGGGLFDQVRGALTRPFLSGEQQEIMNQYGGQLSAERSGVSDGEGTSNFSSNFSEYVAALAAHKAEVTAAQEQLAALKQAATEAGEALGAVATNGRNATVFATP